MRELTVSGPRYFEHGDLVVVFWDHDPWPRGFRDCHRPGMMVMHCVPCCEV